MMRMRTLSDPSIVVVLKAAAGLAAAMGIGRFVYTPILPLMEQQAHLSHTDSALLATINYVGYLIGAISLSLRPRWASSVVLFRSALVLLIASELTMAGTVAFPIWSIARLVAGVASAVVFVGCAQAIAHSRASGLGYAGVGAGVACSGVLVLLLENHLSWSMLWIVSAVLATTLTVPAWSLAPRPVAPAAGRVTSAANPRAWTALFASYFLEGLGYIILGTFLVAAISDGGAHWTGPAAWVVVGLTATLSPILWGALRGRGRTTTILTTALLLQMISALLPALIGGLAAAVVSAVLFGATFISVVMLSMTLGAELEMPHSAAILTAGYAVGQVLGPLVVAPMLSGGYQTAFVVAAGILALSAVCAALIDRRLPRPEFRS